MVNDDGDPYEEDGSSSNESSFDEDEEFNATLQRIKANDPFTMTMRSVGDMMIISKTSQMRVGRSSGEILPTTST